ncbi:MAG: DUF2975 domain-containing protein [Caulobacterales bacterium]|nr:DUF2975 domain-containing protein [Caulobacterales bacterium]
MIAWWALWACAAFVGLAAVAYSVVLAMVANGAIDAAELQNSDGFQIGAFHINFDQPGAATWPIAIPSLLTVAVMIAGALIIVWRLRRLFDSFSSGEPFRRENAAHLRVIWITMVAVELARYFLTASITGLVVAFGEAQGVGVREVSLSVDPSTWGSILILIVLAEVFREGARLKEEQELTI